MRLAVPLRVNVRKAPLPYHRYERAARDSALRGLALERAVTHFEDRRCSARHVIYGLWHHAAGKRGALDVLFHVKPRCAVGFRLLRRSVAAPSAERFHLFSDESLISSTNSETTHY